MILNAAMLYMHGSFLVHHTVTFDVVICEIDHCVDIWFRPFPFYTLH